LKNLLGPFLGATILWNYLFIETNSFILHSFNAIIIPIALGLITVYCLIEDPLCKSLKEELHIGN
jgi:hypothetical protein